MRATDLNGEPQREPGAPIAWIAEDVRAKGEWLYGAASGRNTLKASLTDGTLAMVLYRCMQQSTRWKLAPLAMVFGKLNTFLGGCVIGRGADFGRRFVLIHSGGVYINSSVRGGRDVHVEHQVTIGAERDQSPIVGSGVFLGAGAKVIGPVRIGDGAKVGANAVVVKDVPEHTTVVGVPAKPVAQNRDSAGGEDG